LEDKVTDRVRRVVSGIKTPDSNMIKRAGERLDNLTKPQGSLGWLEDIAKSIVGMTGKENPPVKNKVVFTCAADHGVTAEGISAFPKEVTPQMVYNFLRGGAGINVLARHVGARVVVVDMGVASDLTPHKDLIVKKIGYGTKNMAIGPAMTRAEAVACIEAGFDVFMDEFAKGVDIVGTGDMGIGNTTSASAITAVFTKRPVSEVTGKGTGIDDDTFKHKIAVIEKAIAVNRPDPNDAIDVLSKVGGFEIGGLVGIILAAASKRVPVLIDGFISGAAGLVAFGIEPKVKEYMMASHSSVERGHKIILGHIGLSPILDLGLRLGEGTGAALGMGIVEASVKIMTEMASFKEANVSEKIEKCETSSLQ
jgi:nicotinate-nucleotide--dimethylbenzimidazole phosphoribosyltransferase